MKKQQKTNDPFLREVRKGLRLLRHENELSQKELAHKTGINKGNISHIERGVIKSPNLNTLISLLSAMDTLPSEFFNKINY